MVGTVALYALQLVWQIYASTVHYSKGFILIIMIFDFYKWIKGNEYVQTC